MYVRRALLVFLFVSLAVYDNLKYNITYILSQWRVMGVPERIYIYTYIMYLSRAHIDRGIGTHRCTASSPPRGA